MKTDKVYYDKTKNLFVHIKSESDNTYKCGGHAIFFEDARTNIIRQELSKPYCHKSLVDPTPIDKFPHAEYIGGGVNGWQTKEADTMNVKEELKQLRERIDQLEQQLEPEIAEGQYWKRGNEIKRIESIDDCCSLPISYNAITGTKEEGGSCKRKFLTRDFPHTLLSDKEVEQALIKEAKRRGFDEADKWELNTNTYTLEGPKEYEYDLELDVLYYGNWVIYLEGQFAEIIEDEWEVTHSREYGYFVTNSEFSEQWVNHKLGSKTEAHAIKNALNNLDND